MTKNKILDKRNPLPLTVGCGPLGDDGPTVYIKKKKKQKKETVRYADKKKIPRLSNVPPYTL
jgi:hypothetical protein